MHSLSHSRRKVSAVVGAVWGALVIAGALYLHAGRPEDGRPWLATLMGSEPAHVVAHTFLYGTLAALAYAATRRGWIALLAVWVFGALQEGAQTVWWGIPFGAPEWFDLCVDTLAVLATLGILSYRARDTLRSSQPYPRSRP